MGSETLQFWFEFASAYSYLAAMRIEQVAADAEVTIEWKPFLLGPIFAAQGWNDSPLNVYPIKGRYMWRADVRRCRRSVLGQRPLGGRDRLVHVRASMKIDFGETAPDYSRPLKTC